MLCYIHGITPVKLSTDSQRKYFNCTFQTEDEVLRVVSFTPSLHAQIKIYQHTKAAVRVENFTRTDNGLTLNNNTKFAVERSVSNISFQYHDYLTVTGQIESISALQDIAPDQVLTVKAEVAFVAPVKRLCTPRHGSLEKQEVMLRDPTGFIKLVLWQQYVDSLEVHTTYVLENLKVRVLRQMRYLNTAKDIQFVYRSVEPFDQPLVVCENELADLALKTFTGKIIAVQQLSHTLSCMGCRKKLSPSSADDELAECEECHLVQMIGLCVPQWFLRAIFQDSVTKDLHKLSLFNQAVHLLLEALEIPVDNTSEKDLKLTILKAGRSFNVTFDPNANKVETMTPAI